MTDRGTSGEGDEGDLKDEDRREAKKNREAARLWIAGLKAVARVVDLSATPFFPRVSGYAVGILFPWTVSNLWDHIGRRMPRKVCGKAGVRTCSRFPSSS